MDQINIFAVIVAAASSFLVGGLWYSAILFGAVWNRENGSASKAGKGGHPARVFGVSFLFSLIAAFAFACWLGPDASLQEGVTRGLLAGFGMVAASFGINYQFANRTPLLWLVDGGYHTVQFVLFGVILGLWH
ncbi:DUF1761 domain-containing protein [Steroidobacter sp.]|uniref:DUF1761 domain-containing protein n=1 Tax=Steroidobacter sp. TaxID=1978227 RepID=UPI001A4EA4DA|nr:DUF1761 domain-containing protein [Steroidobacter sp.]MBL8270452.1 DUF1761 domain-containing protein [Steroidobacter sp.]